MKTTENRLRLNNIEITAAVINTSWYNADLNTFWNGAGNIFANLFYRNKFGHVAVAVRFFALHNLHNE